MLKWSSMCSSLDIGICCLRASDLTWACGLLSADYSNEHKRSQHVYLWPFLSQFNSPNKWWMTVGMKNEYAVRGLDGFTIGDRGLGFQTLWFYWVFTLFQWLIPVRMESHSKLDFFDIVTHLIPKALLGIPPSPAPALTSSFCWSRAYVGVSVFVTETAAAAEFNE